MSLLYRKEPDLMRIHNLRLLTWSDRLLWIRLGRVFFFAGLWIAIVLWLLSLRWSIGPWTTIIVTCVGLWGAAAGVATDEEYMEEDLRRWPRRRVTSPPLHIR